MTDLELAKKNLSGHSICLCRSGELITCDARGISPMMQLIAEGRDLCGFSCADVIVGRAAAMLFVKAGVCAVYGRVMSQGALEYLTARDIPCEYGELCENIINRRGDDICPMEKAVAGVEDAEEGYLALQRKLSELNSK